jgi:lipopolysaccharide export system protein LptC
MPQFTIRTFVNNNLTRLNLLWVPLPWLVVILLVVIFFAVKYRDNYQATATPLSSDKAFPQVFMTNVDLREFDAIGALRYQLKTPLIRHFQANKQASAEDYTLFDLPQIVFLDDPQKPAWYMTAQLARSDNNGELFTLTTDVLAQQTSPTQGIISINTAELHLNTHEQFAETDKAVTMRAAKGQVDTLGMRAYLKQDRIELLSHVKGTYEP